MALVCNSAAGTGIDVCLSRLAEYHTHVDPLAWTEAPAPIPCKADFTLRLRIFKYKFASFNFRPTDVFESNL
jgi:hypothetical protein